MELLLPDKDGSICLVMDQDKFYTFHKTEGTWSLASGKGGGYDTNAAPIYEIHVANEGQDIITLSSPYIAGTGGIEVFLDGLLCIANIRDTNGNLPPAYDYKQLNDTQIQFSYLLEYGQVILIRAMQISARPSTEITYQYESSLIDIGMTRVKREIRTGDIESTTEYFYDEYDRVTRIVVTESDNTILEKTIEYNPDGTIFKIVDPGLEILKFHMVPVYSTESVAPKRIFNIENQTEFICNHNLNSIYVQITVWVANKELYCDKEIIDANSVKISNTEPITGSVVIS
jgi:hypothetical protein